MPSNGGIQGGAARRPYRRNVAVPLLLILINVVAQQRGEPFRRVAGGGDVFPGVGITGVGFVQRRDGGRRQIRLHQIADQISGRVHNIFQALPIGGGNRRFPVNRVHRLGGSAAEFLQRGLAERFRTVYRIRRNNALQETDRMRGVAPVMFGKRPIEFRRHPVVYPHAVSAHFGNSAEIFPVNRAVPGVFPRLTARHHPLYIKALEGEGNPLVVFQTFKPVVRNPEGGRRVGFRLDDVRPVLFRLFQDGLHQGVVEIPVKVGDIPLPVVGEGTVERLGEQEAGETRPRHIIVEIP